VRFEVFTGVKTQVKIFCIVMPCSAAGGYQSFGVLRCLHLQDEVILKMEAARSSNTLVSYGNTIQHHDPEDACCCPSRILETFSLISPFICEKRVCEIPRNFSLISKQKRRESEV
jgi:hypothetical protein